MAPMHFHSYIRAGLRQSPVRLALLPQPRISVGRNVLIPLLLTLALFALVGAAQAQVAINTTGAPPTTPNAMLEISSANKGLLAPRMTYTQRNAIPAPPDGLLIYQTDDATTNVKGYYYYDSQTPIVGWRHLADGQPIWLLGGNAGTSLTGLDFIGTLNAQPLNFRVRERELGRITPDGKLQLYLLPPVAPVVNTEMVHVEGAIKLRGGSQLPDQEGTIRYTPGTVIPPSTVRGPGRFEGYVYNAGATSPGSVGWKQIDNNFAERRNQETAEVTSGCADPTAYTYPFVPANVTATPRPWPIPGPISGFGILTGAASPYFTYWEDSRRQFLYLASDLNAAGICQGSGNPIRAIAFSVSSYGRTGPGRIHFLRFRMKNTTAVAVTGFDDAGLVEFAQPNPPTSGSPLSYIVPGAGFHTDGFQVFTGWNVHPFNDGIAPYVATAGFTWNGANLLIDASSDNQEWTNPTLQEGNVASYNTTYSSMISTYCDACGGPPGSTSASACLWRPTGGGFYAPPTTPDNGLPGPPGNNAVGWGWVGGWYMTNNTNTNTCDGTYGYNGGGTPSISSRLPRVAFLAKYVGGGINYTVGDYMHSDEGLMVGDATWAIGAAFKGPGTLSAKRSVWSGTTLLNDYVFDLYYDGVAKAQDAQPAAQYVRTPLKELPNYVERERRLPTIDGRDQWNKQGTFSVDKLGNQLWVTVEDQALYIQELNARMDALKQYLVEKKLKELEGE